MTIDPDIMGRYTYLSIDDVEYRVYYEECGQGIPVFLLHTAGADGRQWRHLLEDTELTKRFRFIAPDLPYHGRSLPPTDIEWWKQDYVLTKKFLETFTIDFSHKLKLDDPVFIGCLLGGQLAGDLALDFPNEFRAVVGIEATMSSGGDENFRRYVYHPRVSNETKGALMLGVCSPLSPRPTATKWRGSTCSARHRSCEATSITT